MEGAAGLISCNEERSQPFEDDSITLDNIYGVIIPLIYIIGFDSALVATKVLCCLIYYAGETSFFLSDYVLTRDITR